MMRRVGWILLTLVFISTVGAETVTVSRRTAAYSAKPGNRIAGYFPAGADLEVMSRTGRFVRVRFISPSGKRVEALALPQDLGLPLQIHFPSNERSKKGWNPVEKETVDIRLLSDRGNRVLKDELYDWDHAQTEHFALHFERGMFARKVSRLAEFYYRYIADDLQGLTDLHSARSHIFIFREPEGWRSFLQYGLDPGMQWAVAFVSGSELFLQDLKDNKAAVNVLAHEMTHLVLNRFFRRQPPLWLNEGLAEWYGAFAYAEYKGTYKTPGSVFRKVNELLPLDVLFQTSTYPQDGESIAAFYRTSFYLVGYLRTEYPEAKFMAFLDAVLDAQPVLEALETMYQITDFEDFEDDFRDFCGTSVD